MKKKRKIIVYIATSADGYIARTDGDVGWLDRPRPKGNYGMGEFLKTIDTILWGRKTYSHSWCEGILILGPVAKPGSSSATGPTVGSVALPSFATMIAC